jgi:hypothetical protein
LEAQIVYNMGGPQPVAQTHFYLIRSDLKDLLRQGVLQNVDKNKSASGEDEATFLGTTLVLMYLSGMGVKAPSSDIKSVISAFNTSKAVWQSSVVQSAETDFKGLANFVDLSPGDYWITGIAETRGGFALWNNKVTIKRGENTLVLSQNNAVFSR